MNLLRPRSLSAMVLLGLAIFVLPLVGALVMAGLQMRQLAAISGRIVADSVATTRLTQELVAETMLLDRRAQAIVRSIGGFGKFTDAMRRQTDQIVLPSRFKFTHDETLETQLSSRQ
jgi:hypothetical protein